MSEAEKYIEMMIDADVEKIIISNPASKQSEYKKITAEKKAGYFHVSKYTEKQVFHENIDHKEAAFDLSLLTDGKFRQINGFSLGGEHIILISKKGKCSYKVKKNTGNAYETADAVTKGPDKINSAAANAGHDTGHNRKKQYILSEGTDIEPLIDMGIFTKEGKVVNSMYDKYKQINRFIEIINDELDDYGETELNVIDFGCGKSYLTFLVYYYLTKIKGIKANIIGLDLKNDVIEKCNEAAGKYHYDGLKFEMGDINGYKAPFRVDMVITLHACDTATDYALYNAIKWNAKMIFSVPCCQHELNKQLKTESLGILSRYGIIKERFSALATDALRANLLECCGYKTQLLEFIDFDHTPKNILIRAVRRPITPESVKKRARSEAEALMKEFSFSPTLFKLLGGDV